MGIMEIDVQHVKRPVKNKSSVTTCLGEFTKVDDDNKN